MALKRSLVALALPLALAAGCSDDTTSTNDTEPVTTADAVATTGPVPTTAAPTTAVEAAESVSFEAVEFDTAGTPPCDSPADIESAWLDASGSDPAEADGLALGSGTTGVMLLHQNDGRICRWLPFAEELVANGYSVVLPIMDNDEWPPPLIPAGMDYLREGGSRTIALVGASMGGTFAIAAQPGLAEPADTVIAVSAPSTYLNADAAAVIADIEAPLLLIAAEEDSQFAEDAEEMAALASDATLEVRPGRDHGVVLVDHDETARGMVLQAIADAGGSDPSATTSPTETTTPEGPGTTVAAPAGGVTLATAEFDTAGTAGCDLPPGVDAAWLDASGSDPERADALALGSGSTGVVLLHQSDGRICPWMPFAEELVADGYAVVLPRMESEWPQPIIPAGMAYLREEGSDTIALIGASMGGTFAIAAAPDLTTPPDAIVAVSPPASFRGADAGAVIANVEPTPLLIVAEEDSDFAEAAATMGAAAPDMIVELRPGSSHGIALLSTDDTAKVLALQAIADAGPAG